MGDDELTHDNFDFRGFDVPDLKAVTLAAASDTEGPGKSGKKIKSGTSDKHKSAKPGK